jgi:addiction module RelE/StbE family toxin
VSRGIRWTRRALRRLNEIGEYIAAHDPAAADRVVRTIARRTLELRDHPMIGRTGRVEGTRELVVGGTPYLVAYCIQVDAIVVLTILHAAQAWPDGL